MHAEKIPGWHGSESESRVRCRPRVVIFRVAGTLVVEVVDLPESVNLGHRICHRGRDWLVTGVRTGERVLIAEPDAS